MIIGSKEKEMEKRKLSQPLSHHLQEKGNEKRKLSQHVSKHLQEKVSGRKETATAPMKVSE